MPKHKIQWPAWVWHENAIDKWEDVERGIRARFGMGHAHGVVSLVFRAACIRVNPTVGYLDGMYTASTKLNGRERRRAWRLAMEMLGYTEMSDA